MKLIKDSGDLRNLSREELINLLNKNQINYIVKYTENKMERNIPFIVLSGDTHNSVIVYAVKYKLENKYKNKIFVDSIVYWKDVVSLYEQYYSYFPFLPELSVLETHKYGCFYKIEWYDI